MATRESFGQFVTRILNEKKLSLSDVERKTHKAISDSYLSFIIQDKGVNLTLRKLRALAQGLGVSEAMILEAACGIPLAGATTNSAAGEFADLVYKYERLSDQDKSDLLPMLQILRREIERRLGSNNGEQKQ